MDGKREWLVAWSGVDGTGKQWADTWQPTRSLTPDLKHNFFYDRAQRALRVVEVDARPLDTLVQRAIAQTVMGELGASFGSVHYIPVPALSLGDLAQAYMGSLSERFGVVRKEATVGQVTTVELQLTEPNQSNLRAPRKYIMCGPRI